MRWSCDGLKIGEILTKPLRFVDYVTGNAAKQPEEPTENDGSTKQDRKEVRYENKEQKQTSRG